MVSVALCTYNGEKYISAQLRSVLANLEKDDELIVSDDGSTDRTRRILLKFAKKDKRIRLIDGPKQGVAANFENAIKAAKGDYIFLCDQDDIWKKEKVKKMLAAFGTEQAGVIVHDANIVNEKGDLICKSFFHWNNLKYGFWGNLFKNSFIGCCMAFKKELKEFILPFPKDIPMHDQWIGLIALKTLGVYFLRESLTNYRRHYGNVTGRVKLPLRQKYRNRMNIFKNISKRLKNIPLKKFGIPENSTVFAVVVVYNKSVANVVTLKTLEKIHKNILVIDNSTSFFNNQKQCAEKGFEYYKMNGNEGLSKAYNKAVELIQDRCGFISLFDDDTKVPDDYFLRLKDSIQHSPEAVVFAPYVFDEKSLISPCKFKGIKGRRVKRPKRIPYQYMSAINSGLCVRSDLYSYFRYDPALFLDYVDHSFIKNTKKIGAKIAVFDAVLTQQFSVHEKDMVKSLNRFKIFKKDLMSFCEDNCLFKAKAKLYILACSFKLNFKFKTFKFFKK